MRKRLKLLAVCAVAASVLTGLSYLAVYGFNWHRREVSSSLIGELKRLEVGKATEVQVRALSDRYGGTYSPAHIQDQVPQPARYDVAVTSPHILIADSTRTLPGLREWDLGVSLDVEQGYLSRVDLSLYVSRSDGFELISMVRLTGSDPAEGSDGLAYEVREAHITGPPGEALSVRLGPTATMKEREKGLGFNFSCLTSLRECRHVCDTMPSAWRDLIPQRRLTYEDGSPVNDYKECGEGTP